MLTGYPPNWCDESDPIKIMNLIAHSNTIPDFPDEISEDCLDFLEQCISWIPSKRLTAKQLLTHPFITSTTVKIKDLSNNLEDWYKRMIREFHERWSLLHHSTSWSNLTEESKEIELD